MSLLLWILIAYAGIGVALAATGPLRKSVDMEYQATALHGDDVARWRLAAFRYVLLAGIVVLWPVFLPGILRMGTRSKSVAESSPPRGQLPLQFSQMGGAGVISCLHCRYFEEIVSFTHGRDGFAEGYQCQSCGKFATRDYEQPFADRGTEARIEHALLMVRLIEGNMKRHPKEEWASDWEPDLAEYREELSHVPQDELARIKRMRDEANSKYRASLVCECGGKLDREKALFCPGCRKTNLSYDMKYIT